VSRLDNQVPLEDWCNIGLSLIKFQVDAEYAVLNKILETSNGHSTILIHSKPLRDLHLENVTTIDATGHALTAQNALRQRIRASDDDSTLENPEDIQNILSQFQRRRKSNPDTKWWIWWSPSDLVTHDVEETEIVRCLRALANDFSDNRFLVLVAKDVHSKQTLARLEYISETTVNVDRDKTRGQITHNWSVRKHHDTKIEGAYVIA
jgi:hypothetical protein